MFATVACVMYALMLLAVLLAIWAELASLVETLKKGGRR